MTNRISVILFSIALSAFSSVKADSLSECFNPIFESNSNKVKLGKFKGQKHKGKYDGMGVIRLKNGDIYFGDVLEGSPDGKGVYICADGNEISGCPGSVVYVGRFKDGKMKRGKCLDDESELTYNGDFVQGAPEQPYPMSEAEAELGYFGCMSPADIQWTYVGEMSQETPHGKGIIIFPTGDFLISDFEWGNRKGIGVYVDMNGEWQTEKAVDGDIVVMSSSSYYSQIDEERKRNNREVWSQVFSYFSEALVTGVQAVEIAKSPVVSTTRADGGDVSLSGSSEDASSSNYEAMYAKWEQRAESCYNTITNLGSSYTDKDGDKSGSAGQSMSSGNYVNQKKSFREAQRQMRNIRQKAAKRGIDIRMSKWETATISY